jgi:transposase
MAYSVDFRKRVLAFLEEGNSLRKAREIFKVSINAIQGWKKLKAETGKLEKRPSNIKPRIYISEKLEAYIVKNPTAYLKDIAETFGGSVSAAGAALKRLKISLKKGLSRTPKEIMKNAKNLIKK